MGDYEDMQSDFNKSQIPFPCNCGGTLYPTDHNLTMEKGEFVDEIEFTCFTCERKVTQSMEVPHMTKTYKKIVDDAVKSAKADGIELNKSDLHDVEESVVKEIAERFKKRKDDL
jgi:hypothetical protein